MSRRSTKERLSLTVNDEHASKSTSASLSTSTMSVKDSDNGNCESQAVKEVETYETLAKELSTLKVKLAAKIEKMKDADSRTWFYHFFFILLCLDLELDSKPDKEDTARTISPEQIY